MKNFICGLLTLACLSCEPSPPSGDYDRHKRHKRYDAAHTFISDREGRKWGRSDIRFFDALQADLTGSLVPTFSESQYTGTKTKPIGWVVRVFGESQKIYQGWTTVSFDLEGNIVMVEDKKEK